MTKVYVVTTLMPNFPEDDHPWVDGVFSTEEAAKAFAASVQRSTYIYPADLDPPPAPEYEYWMCEFDLAKGKLVGECTLKASNAQVQKPHTGAVRGLGCRATIISTTSLEHCKRIAKAYYDDLLRGAKHPSLTYYYD